MKRILSDTQAAFFTKNGFIEFEMPFEMPAFKETRDQWREEEKLKQFILRKLGPLSLVLTGKKRLCLALSQWITKNNRPKTSQPLFPFLSIQNIALAISISPHPHIPEKKSSLGILPLPSNSSQILFFKPHLILDWPHVESDLFLILLGHPHAVYVQNPNDPDTSYLKKLGVEYGDTLPAKTHPLIL